MSILLRSVIVTGLSNIGYGLTDENKSTVGFEIPIPFPLIKNMPSPKYPSSLPFTSDISSKDTLTPGSTCEKVAIGTIKATGYETSSHLQSS